MKLKQTIICDFPLEELGWEMEQAFNRNPELDEEFRVIREGYANDGEPILISEFIEILELMKSKGCNYFQIDTSHHGYEVHGSKIETFTESELEDLKEKERQVKIKQLKLEKVLIEQKLSRIIENLENI